MVVKFDLEPCSVENCTANVRSKHEIKYCTKHAYKRKCKNPQKVRPMYKDQNIPCKIDSCTRFARFKEMCEAHYVRNKKGKDLTTPIFDKSVSQLYKFRKDVQAIVTDETIVPHSDGYTYIYVSDFLTGKTKKVLEHRYVMMKNLGRELSSNENIHHKNGVRNDNRIENLELWSTVQPAGQRVEDKVEWAIEILKVYAPHLLSKVN